MPSNTEPGGPSPPFGEVLLSVLEGLLLQQPQLEGNGKKALHRQFGDLTAEDVEDIWQESLVLACQLLTDGKLKEEVKLPAWLWQCAYHRAVDLLRHRKTTDSAE